MGYTHYFSTNKPKGLTAFELEVKYQKAISECSKIARVYNARCEKLGFDAARLSGYTAHSKPGRYGGLGINGTGDLAHEDFSMREHFYENTANFCKTARKPYDVVVTACLAVLKYRLGDAFIVSSDGHADDWFEGVNLASSILRRKIPNPMANKIG